LKDDLEMIWRGSWAAAAVQHPLGRQPNTNVEYHWQDMI